LLFVLERAEACRTVGIFGRFSRVRGASVAVAALAVLVSCSAHDAPKTDAEGKEDRSETQAPGEAQPARTAGVATAAPQPGLDTAPPSVALAAFQAMRREARPPLSPPIAGARALAPGLAPPSDEAAIAASEATAFTRIGTRYAPVLAKGAKGRSAAVEIELASRVSDPFAVRHVASGIAVEVTLRDATDAAGVTEHGYVTYADALTGAPGAHVLHRPTADGTEDYVRFQAAPSRETLHYSVALGDKVRGVRFVENTLELLDETGAPRLRMAAPYLVDAAGHRDAAKVTLAGCQADTSPAAPWGRPVTAPGAQACEVTVSWHAPAAKYPLVVDPGWTATGSMAANHGWGARALLASGKVLAAGGGSGPSAELYDRGTETWSATGTLQFTHVGTVGGVTLSTGKVLVAGGNDSGTTTELYDPVAGTWSSGAPMSVPRAYYSPSSRTLLQDGRVLIAGGYNTNTGTDNATTEIYTPNAGAGTWAASGNMVGARRETFFVVLNDGRVFTPGGYDDASAKNLGTAEIFNPATNTWTATGSASTVRNEPAGAVLADGKVLVAGGSGGSAANTAEIFDPATGAFTAAGTMANSRQYFSLALLGNGQVLAVGGFNGTTTRSSLTRGPGPGLPAEARVGPTTSSRSRRSLRARSSRRATGPARPRPTSSARPAARTSMSPVMSASPALQEARAPPVTHPPAPTPPARRRRAPRTRASSAMSAWRAPREAPARRETSLPAPIPPAPPRRAP
jgi:hypothetical protein